ncbi:LOW QUALITY PROTEIN: nodal homolog [Melanerpes formicivorus]|uniref:LOW QUALITY PROTEIN: nodal homolog n=1 Tax=Melanerpes formicivorus TaxID=211600 RepID=UPI00358FCCA2
MRVPLRSALVYALVLLRLGCAHARAPTWAPTWATPRAPPRCPALMLQLLRTPPAPLRAVAAAAFSISPHVSLQNGSRWTLAFDMSSLSSSQDVSLAQIRLYLPDVSPSQHMSLNIYHSQRQSCPDDEESCAQQLFLGTVAGRPTSIQKSWKIFEVTNVLRTWLHQAVVPGLHHPTGGEGSESSAPATTTMPSPTTSDAGPEEPQDGTNRVLLLVFSKDKSPEDHSLIKTAETSKHVMRDCSPATGARRHRRNRKEKQRIRVSAGGSSGEEGRPLCRRVDMMVDFEKTGWDSWIVHPKKYNAYRCEGRCPSPVDETFKPTNHAYIQSLLQLYKPNHVPCPVCSPVRMSPLSMLYLEKGKAVIRHHEDMVIEECGCN